MDASRSLVSSLLVLALVGCTDSGPRVGVDHDASDPQSDQGTMEDTGDRSDDEDTGGGMDLGTGEDSGSDQGSSPDADMGGTDMAADAEADAAADMDQTDLGDPVTYTLTIDILGNGSGYVEGEHSGDTVRCDIMNSPCAYQVAEGASVTLTPRPGPDTRMCPWFLGPCRLMEGECTFEMTDETIASVRLVDDPDGDALCP